MPTTSRVLHTPSSKARKHLAHSCTARTPPQSTANKNRASRSARPTHPHAATPSHSERSPGGRSASTAARAFTAATACSSARRNAAAASRTGALGSAINRAAARATGAARAGAGANEPEDCAAPRRRRDCVDGAGDVEGVRASRCTRWSLASSTLTVMSARSEARASYTARLRPVARFVSG